MTDVGSSDHDRVRTAELMAALSLATDLGMGLPLEHGLLSTLVATRLCERMGVDTYTRFQSYYLCLLFYIGCTASADVDPMLFDEDFALATYASPHRFGSRAEMAMGMLRALAPPTKGPVARGKELVRGVPRLIRAYPDVSAAGCEVAQMLTNRFGLPASVATLFPYEGGRWDGFNMPRGVRGEDIPLAARIVNVARDAALQSLFADPAIVAGVIGRRAGGGLDPSVAGVLAGEASEILTIESGESLWDLVLAAEPAPQLTLEGAGIDRALAAMGDFSDLISPYTIGHSAGVAELARAAATLLSLDPGDCMNVGRAGVVHDLGRVAVPSRVWMKSAPLTTDDREKVRLHAYHTERLLAPSGFLAPFASVAGAHHERLDGSGYHRGLPAAALDTPARLLAAADAYHAMTEPRPHREALSPEDASELLAAEAHAGHLGIDAVRAVIEAAGQRVPRLERPAGLTDREIEVVALLTRGRQTKQVARDLGISAKTADRHIQNAYRKMGVSTRAGAAMFSMQHGLTTWGELPMGTVDPLP